MLIESATPSPTACATENALSETVDRKMTENQPLVSVVVASYNHAPYVAASLRSVLEQRGVASLELLVTDDGSKDGTAEAVAALRDRRIRLNAFLQNRGACVALNDAIRRSRGRYIAVLNSDDLFLPGKLQRQVDYLEQHPEVAAVFAWPTLIDDNGRPFDDPQHKDSAVFRVQNRSRHQWLRHFFDSGNALCHPSLLIRREVYQTVGLYDPRLAQVPDLDMWIRLCLHHEIHILTEPLIAFRIRAGQQNASAASPHNIRRDAWERAYILRHYLALDAAAQSAVFPELTRLTGSWGERLARHALSFDYPFYHRFALDAWFASLPDGGRLPEADTAADAQEQAGLSGDPTAWRRFISASGATDPHRLHSGTSS